MFCETGFGFRSAVLFEAFQGSFHILVSFMEYYNQVSCYLAPCKVQATFEVSLNTQNEVKR